MRNPGNGGKELAQAVDKKLMFPVRAVLGRVSNVFISTDGALSLLPFTALVDENGRYLVENYSFTYLTSGRDLLRLQTRSTIGQAPVAIAAPRFDRTDEPSITSGTTPGGTRGTVDTADFSNLTFGSLPDSIREADVLKRYLPTTVTLSGGNATEAAVKGLRGPLVLHVATHGFFLADQTRDAARQVPFGPAAGNILQAPTMTVGGNPLLRSGLWLAGANQRAGGRNDDGVLTALETASLNLDGTELVVLSACETGIGDIQNGEGVYGLRRSLLTAGARSAVVSLWKVNADATTDIMTKYYDHLLRRHEGRTEALRQAQLEMLRNQGTNQDYSSPYFWAGFIPLGDWKPLNSREP
jgi:CHAT domain-containing protein